MAVKEKRIEKFKVGCRTTSPPNAEKNTEFNKDLFDSDWEVFVIKRDTITGKLVGRTACCALSPV